MSDASSSSGRRITVTSVSCRGVKAFVPFQKPPLYAAVSLGGRREKSPADPDGGENPDWDGAVFAFDLDGAGEGDSGLLQFEVKAQVPLLGNKLVGTTCVPVSHLGDGTVPERVSYQVLAPDGKPNGSLSFVYVVTGGSAYQRPQIYAAPNGARPEQDVSFCCAPPPPPPSGSAYTSPTMPNFAPHGSSYPPAPPPPSGSAYPPPTTPNPNFAPHGSSYPPPPVSASLYPPPPPDMLPPSHYRPPPQMMDSLFPASNSGLNSCYPPLLTTAYPPAPASSASYSVPSTQDISNYPPPPPRYYPPLPPSGYPPPQMERIPTEFPARTSSYPPPPPPDSGSISSVLTRSTRLRSMDHELPCMAPSFQDSVVTYPELPGLPVPSGGSYYPPSTGQWHHKDGASSPYYYPHPGARYS